MQSQSSQSHEQEIDTEIMSDSMHNQLIKHDM